jgi:hypothetical protein
MSEQTSPIIDYIATDGFLRTGGDVFDVEAMLRLFARDEVLQRHRPAAPTVRRAPTITVANPVGATSRNCGFPLISFSKASRTVSVIGFLLGSAGSTMADPPDLKVPAMRKPVGPDTPSQPGFTPNLTPIGVQHSVILALRHEAARRDVPVARLIQDLLSVIATDHLTRAVLGDD